jgi:hypothetical protein
MGRKGITLFSMLTSITSSWRVYTRTQGSGLAQATPGTKLKAPLLGSYSSTTATPRKNHVSKHCSTPFFSELFSALSSTEKVEGVQVISMQPRQDSAQMLAHALWNVCVCVCGGGGHGKGGRQNLGLHAQSPRFPTREAGLRQKARSLSHCSSQWVLEELSTCLWLMGGMKARREGMAVPPEDPPPDPGGSLPICLISHAPF